MSWLVGPFVQDDARGTLENGRDYGLVEVGRGLRVYARVTLRFNFCGGGTLILRFHPRKNFKT